MNMKLLDLPNHILEEISVRVAKSSVYDILNLSLVTKSFYGLSQTSDVLCCCNVEVLPVNPYFITALEREKCRLFLKKLRKLENGNALCRKGVRHYFNASNSGSKRSKGFGELYRSATQGHAPTLYLLGIILVCEEGVRKDEGYGYLGRLMRPSLIQTIHEVGEMRMKCSAFTVMSPIISKEILTSYAPSICKCGDEESINGTLMFLIMAYNWQDEPNFVDKANFEDPICEKCFWHREIILLLADNPEHVEPRI